MDKCYATSCRIVVILTLLHYVLFMNEGFLSAIKDEYSCLRHLSIGTPVYTGPVTIPVQGCEIATLLQTFRKMSTTSYTTLHTQI